jgi:hypothetical protein
MCVVLFLLGMLLANMLKSVCGCKVVEGSKCRGENSDAIRLGVEDDTNNPTPVAIVNRICNTHYAPNGEDYCTSQGGSVNGSPFQCVWYAENGCCAVPNSNSGG